MTVQMSAPSNEDVGSFLAGAGGIDLRLVQDFFSRRWKIVLLSAIVVPVLTSLALMAITPKYTATAQIMLDPHKNKVLGSDAVLPDITLDSGIVDSQITLIQSVGLLRHLVEKENLTEDNEFGGTPAPSFFRSLLRKVGFKIAAPVANDDKDSVIPGRVLNSIGLLAAALDVQRVNRTYVLSVAVTSKDPAKAARLANAVANVYIDDQLENRYGAARAASSWFASRLENVAKQVRDSEEAVANFRRENNLVTTSSESKVTFTDQQLADLNTKLIAARSETAERRVKYEQAVQVQARGGNLQAIPDVVHSPLITDLRRQEAEISRKVSDLRAHYNDSYPLVVQASAELRALESSLNTEVVRIITTLKNDYDVAKAREDSLAKGVREISSENGNNNDVGVKLRELERANAANKALFENMLSRSKITDEQASFEEHDARVISPAFETDVPSYPKKGLIVFVAFIGGLFVGAVIGAILDMLSAGFSTPRQLEDKLGLPVLGGVALVSARERLVDGKRLELPHYLARNPLSRFAEGVRAVRVGVQMSDPQHPAKVVLITSSLPSEGKTTTSICLAFSAMKADQKVLIIDGDLRHPSVTQFFGYQLRPGIVDVMSGNIDCDEAILHSDGIDVLPVGSKSQNPPDLLGSEKMKALFESLRSKYDYIVVDSPPVAPVIDAKVLVALCDKVVFVVKWAATGRETVAQYLIELSANRKLAGVVLSQIDESRTPRYGAYAYYSGKYDKNYFQA